MKRILFGLLACFFLFSTAFGEDYNREELKETLKKEYGLIWFGNVRDDVTGNWRLSECASKDTVDKYALDYYRAYFEDDKEIHGIINFTLKTTTRLRVFNGTILCDTLEYVDGEEHSAKTLFSGLLLTQKEIDIETGEVTDIEPEYDASSDDSVFSTFLSLVEPALQESFGENIKIDTDGNFLSISVWTDGASEEVIAAKLGNAAMIEDYGQLKGILQDLAGTLTKKAQEFVPGSHVLFSLLNDTNLDNVIMSFLDGEVYYDYLTE